jgi:hypothetical protein
MNLVAWKGIRQNALKGHIIAFGTTAVSAINRTGALLFQWFSDNVILTCFKESFVIPNNVADKCFKALCLDGGLLRADVKPIIYWLGLLQACHAGYSHLQLPSQAQQDTTQVKLRELQTIIIAGAQLVHSRISRTIKADIAPVSSLPEDHG